jgi:hypothetical protein
MVEQASSSTALDCKECDAVRRNEQSHGTTVCCTCRAWRKSGLACSSFGLKTRGVWFRLVHQHGWSTWAYMEHVRLGNRSVRWTPWSMYRSRLGASEHRAVATKHRWASGTHLEARRKERVAHMDSLTSPFACRPVGRRGRGPFPWPLYRDPFPCCLASIRKLSALRPLCFKSTVYYTVHTHQICFAHLHKRHSGVQTNRRWAPLTLSSPRKTSLGLYSYCKIRRRALRRLGR